MKKENKHVNPIWLFYFISKRDRYQSQKGVLRKAVNLIYCGDSGKKKKYVVKNIIFMDLLICDKLIILKKTQLLTPKNAE